MIRVEYVLDTWKAVRVDTAQAVRDMPGGDMSFKPMPEVDSFGDIARHVLHASNALTGMMLAGVEDMTVNFRENLPKYFYPVADNATPDELAAALDAAADQRAVELAGQTPEWWSGMIVRFDGQKVTRLEMMQLVKEHELTHRSQLFMYLRLKGVVPATTRRRLEKRRAEKAN